MPRPLVDYHNCKPDRPPCPFKGWHWDCPDCVLEPGNGGHDGPFDNAAEAYDEAVLHLREKHRA